MKVGIVGHEAAKFTPETEVLAKAAISSLVAGASEVVSGECHLGGVDVWAHEAADAAGVPFVGFPPKTRAWEGGYKQRNLQIAAASDEVHCIVVAEYPASYKGMRFDYCYHCGTSAHIKSGGCWTAKRAKHGVWHIIGAARGVRADAGLAVEAHEPDHQPHAHQRAGTGRASHHPGPGGQPDAGLPAAEPGAAGHGGRAPVQRRGAPQLEGTVSANERPRDGTERVLADADDGKNCDTP